ncbi:MAG TPA: sigma-70 family RNA polymerase sigma factor [Thermoanaerobaculia bacterium]|jgi:RNA polymerase sigma factor (TIGR02999 family)
MTEAAPPAVTALLQEWSRGDSGALERLTPIVYEELRRIAAGYMRKERPGHTLQATALVNEAYVRLIGQKRVSWQNRAHFFGIAAQLMRRVLIDHARRRQAEKRGADRLRVSTDAEIASGPDLDFDMLAIDGALTRLERLDPPQARIVELRFFGGLTVEETAEVVGISTATVKREWRTARVWLRREVGAESE